MSEAFPKPQPGSQEWHKYLTQRREHGDTRTMCPDTMSEAEKLFGISDRGMSYSVQGNNEGDKASLSPCDYLELQKRQNEDWADYIAQSIPEPTENGRDWHDVLGKLDHALSLDPECAMALGRRAQV
ncbi:hypothetical protein GGI11_003022 [Coemansia sp. RSA 2049]|nr:hypothetical protein GGI11_003022 [Coemansia sp. RSA 2049]KAJ2518446.1 hypothetical protein H4217_003322 [Coemansia sp. RSA 1939]KAJ2693808.1 hypothetical protein GGH99_000984 [Coemansia sp. RSA 1285]